VIEYRRPAPSQKEQKMWRKIATDIKAAVRLIAAEDIGALRSLARTIANLARSS
jgi:hypothetical protein